MQTSVELQHQGILYSSSLFSCNKFWPQQNIVKSFTATLFAGIADRQTDRQTDRPIYLRELWKQNAKRNTVNILI